MSEMTVNEAMETILNSELHIPTIPEYLFVGKYLPMLAGVNEQGTNILPWLEVAGTVYNPVKVLNAAGEVLFTVPPLMRKVEVKDTEDPSQYFSEIVANAKNKAHVSEALADQYLERMLAGRVSSVVPDAKHVAAWNVIFKRYGYPTIDDIVDGKDSAVSDGALSTNSNSSDNSQTDDDDQFEIL